MYVHKRPVYNMVSLRLEPKGEIREIYLELQKCICTFLPHICGAEQIVSLALVLRNMSRPPSRPALTRALCLLCSDQSDDIWIITNLKTTTALNSQLACDPPGCRSCLPFIRQEWYALKWFWPANFQLKVYKKNWIWVPKVLSFGSFGSNWTQIGICTTLGCICFSLWFCFVLIWKLFINLILFPCSEV